MTQTSSSLVQQTAQIVSAYLAAAKLSAEEVPELIRRVHGALTTLDPAPTAAAPAPASPRKRTSVQIRNSVTPDWLVSFEDGRRYKTLRAHLAKHGLTPACYRAKWGLPADYPMSAPNLSALRSANAHRIGLAQYGRGQSAGRAGVSAATGAEIPSR